VPTRAARLPSELPPSPHSPPPLQLRPIAALAAATAAAALTIAHHRPAFLAAQKRTADEATALEKKLLAGERKKRRKLEAAGIDYEFGGYEAAVAQREKKRKRAASA